MKRLAVILSGLLVLQVGGAVALALSGPDYAAFRPSDPLLAFDPEAVTEVAIDETNGDSVVLRRQDGGWALPDTYDFPADDAKVTKLLTDLGSLKKGLPVATTGGALERFKVTDDDHERRVVLRGKDGKLGEILIGSSPSYRQVHARTPDDPVVYSVRFAIYDAAARSNDWLDKNFLHLSEDNIQRVLLPSMTLSRKDDGFVVDGLAEGEKTDQSAAGKLVGKIASLNFAAVEGKGEAALARLDAPDMTFTVELKDGDPVTFRLEKIEDKDDYLLSSGAHDYLFKVSKYSVQPLLDASREKLIQEKPADNTVSGRPKAEQGGGSG